MQDALGYIRVSSEEQADSGLGLEAQRQRIAASAASTAARASEAEGRLRIAVFRPVIRRRCGNSEQRQQRPLDGSEGGR
jgi:DNA invertase Pin-like site-specific DNA recombinase